MKELIVVGDEFIKAELYIEAYFGKLLNVSNACIQHINTILAEGIKGEDAPIEEIAELLKPIAFFNMTKVQGSNAFVSINLMKGYIDEFIENIDTIDDILY